MLPILAGLLSTLASKGLGVLAGAITAKGKQFVEDKIGMKIPDNPTSAEMATLKIAEMEHEEVLLELAIKKSQLSLEEYKIEVDNTKSAREMNTGIQTSTESTKLAKNTAYILDFIIVGSTLALAGFLMFFNIPVPNKELAYMAFGSLLALCATVINFHRGTSASSRSKDSTINTLTKGVM